MSVLAVCAPCAAMETTVRSTIVRQLRIILPACLKRVVSLAEAGLGLRSRLLHRRLRRPVGPLAEEVARETVKP